MARKILPYLAGVDTLDRLVSHRLVVIANTQNRIYSTVAVYDPEWGNHRGAWFDENSGTLLNVKNWSPRLTAIRKVLSAKKIFGIIEPKKEKSELAKDLETSLKEAISHAEGTNDEVIVHTVVTSESTEEEIFDELVKELEKITF